MAEANAAKQVYVRVDYNGYIPILNVHGPVRGNWIDKEKIKELIRAGYRVIFLNRDACPEFCKQMDLYRDYVEKKDYINADKVLKGSGSGFLNLEKDPNSIVEQAVNLATQTTKQPEIVPTNPGVSVVKDALAAAGVEAPEVSSEITANPNEAASAEGAEGPVNSAGEPVVNLNAGEASANEPVDADNPFADQLGRIEGADSTQPETPAAYAAPVSRNGKGRNKQH